MSLTKPTNRWYSSDSQSFSLFNFSEINSLKAWQDSTKSATLRKKSVDQLSIFRTGLKASSWKVDPVAATQCPPDCRSAPWQSGPF